MIHLYKTNEKLMRNIREFAEGRAALVDQEIRTALVGAKITGVEIVAIPRRKRLVKLVILTDAKPISFGSVRYDLSKIVLKVKL